MGYYDGAPCDDPVYDDPVCGDSGDYDEPSFDNSGHEDATYDDTCYSDEQFSTIHVMMQVITMSQFKIVQQKLLSVWDCFYSIKLLSVPG